MSLWSHLESIEVLVLLGDGLGQGAKGSTETSVLIGLTEQRRGWDLRLASNLASLQGLRVRIQGLVPRQIFSFQIVVIPEGWWELWIMVNSPLTSKAQHFHWKSS